VRSIAENWIVFVLFVMAGCRAPKPAAPARAEARNGEVASNVTFADYAGSEACRRCHPDEHARWSASPMHKMTRLPAREAIQAPFAGERFKFKNDEIVMETHEGDCWMRLRAAGQPERLYRVTRVIGGHHREDFAGVEVDQTQPGLPSKGEERVLPANFQLETKQWRYKGYSVMTPERPYLRAGASWAKTCIFCHNTEPYLDAIFGALAGPSVGPYQGEVVDPLLPADKRVSLRVTDRAALDRALGAEIVRLGAKPVGELLPEAVRATRAMFTAKKLVEIGIGCEACHGGAKEHVEHVGVSPVYEPRAPWLRVEPPQSRVQQLNRVCARCHQVLFTKYPWTWEGGQRRADPPGGSHINSGEARDFLMGACSTQMSCVACHDPHAPDNDKRMREVGDAVCLKCHAKFSTAEALRAHAHHDPAGEGARCMNCHMPRKNMSLDNRLTRYHRIGSPNAVDKVERDRPLECALCHSDWSVAKIVTTMEQWWGKKYDRSALEALYGALPANAIRATLERGKAHEQAAALGVLAERKDRDAAPLIARALVHAYPIVRYFALRAIVALTGREPPIDLFQDNAKIFSEASGFLRAAGFDVATYAPSATSSDGNDE
jgi:predicted CXXCH cytochrome family protein